MLGLQKVPHVKLPVCYKEIHPVFLYPHVPFWYVCGIPNFGIIPWQGKYRLYDCWSFFPREDPILQKELCFLGTHWIAPLFSREAAFTLCLTNHTPKTQTKRYHKEFTHELFWKFFLASSEVFQVWGYFSHKTCRHQLADKSTAGSAPTSLAVVKALHPWTKFQLRAPWPTGASQYKSQGEFMHLVPLKTWN